MTLNNPYLFLNRLIIISYTGATAYDQKFHKGVNIIRGDNSAGKSTISNFIFFALGGDYNNWNMESLKCREVYAEVEINGGTYTLKRNVTTLGRQPMSIYWGTFDEAKDDSINWKTFSYQQTDERVSYTNILFNALNYPEVRSDADNNITFHQILRLIYIDQDTPTQGLFKRELFDHPLTRQAISELLLGIYDDVLYNDRVALRKTNKDYEEKKREYDNLLRLYSKSGNALSVDELINKINKVKGELEKTQSEITRIRAAENIRIATNSTLGIEKIQKELIPAKQKLNDLSNSIYELDLDIVDSKNFIETLNKRIKALDNSMLTRKVLGEISLEVCPKCFHPLENHVPENHCSLCKRDLTDSEEITQAKRLKQELELQVKESTALLIKKERTLSDLRGNLPVWKQKTVTLQKELDSAINQSQSTRDSRLDELLISKGAIERQIELLTEQMGGIELLTQLRKEITQLSAEIERLEQNIKQREYSLRVKGDAALNHINSIAVKILKRDLPRQNEFKVATKVDIDFYGDTFSLDGNFNFSASSNTYLKNAIRFAIFFASLDLDFMRYPKFLLCDNIEDKGMQPDRSKNFQHIIIDLSNAYMAKNEHQIIFSTSMIAEDLEGTPYCVGDYYTIDGKTLKI